MIPLTYIAPREQTSPSFGLAFSEGCDGEVTDQFSLPKGDFAMFGSPDYIDLVFHARRKKLNFYYGDHAYFHRYRYYRVTKNALQHTGEGESDGKRFQELNLSIADWKQRRGDEILLCPNSERFYTFWGHTQKAWTNKVVEEIRKVSDRPIKVKQKTDSSPLKSHFPRTWAIVVYTSNCAIDAALAGIPAFATEKCAANALCSKDLSLIESPPMANNRQEVFNVLADNQWNIAEIRSGMAWEHFREGRDQGDTQ